MMIPLTHLCLDRHKTKRGCVTRCFDISTMLSCFLWLAYTDYVQYLGNV